MTKQFSPSSERNREPILHVLRDIFANSQRVLEIGSGTGQHAVIFAAAMPGLVWQPSDRAQYHPSILAWQQETDCKNVLPPLALDVNDVVWPNGPYDGVFSANTCHIMAWEEVENMFAGIGRLLSPGGVVALYGPFNYHGQFTSAGNADFDVWLRRQAAHMGIRDFEAVNALAGAQGLVLQRDIEMPANNRMLVWQRVITG
jgi:cyclopropane fatty-acyl-phospholipid synthase-like methyltransferase